jgi:hypothetical protein
MHTVAAVGQSRGSARNKPLSLCALSVIARVIAAADLLNATVLSPGVSVLNNLALFISVMGALGTLYACATWRALAANSTRDSSAAALRNVLGNRFRNAYNT